jgi:hypothetical protein
MHDGFYFGSIQFDRAKSPDYVFSTEIVANGIGQVLGKDGLAVATGQDIFEGRYVFITDGVMAFYGRQCTAILAESDSLRLISLAASDGNKFWRTATTTRP